MRLISLQTAAFCEYFKLYTLRDVHERSFTFNMLINVCTLML